MYELATFGSGCFWCTEAIFQRVQGIIQVTSGYSGGKKENADYAKVCAGTTLHAEVIQVEFDPEIVSFKELLEIFWKTHDPTTANRQGNDVGPQYRSVIFYHNESQHALAEDTKGALTKEKIYPSPIVTEIVPFTTFFPAENYHQDYYNSHANTNPYCSYVITPKIEKLKKIFQEKVNKPGTSPGA